MDVNFVSFDLLQLTASLGYTKSKRGKIQIRRASILVWSKEMNGSIFEGNHASEICVSKLSGRTSFAVRVNQVCAYQERSSGRALHFVCIERNE
jgi:hypothetical protein